MKNNNLLIDFICVTPFEREGVNFNEVNKTYFVFAEYSEEDTSDLAKTTDWIINYAKEGKLIIKHPERFLPESNFINKDIFPYITTLTEYCRSIIK